MSERVERLAGALFAALSASGYERAEQAALAAYQDAVRATPEDREGTSRTVAVDMLSAIETHLTPAERIEVITAAVDRLEREFETVVDAVPVPVVMVDADGVVRTWNRAAAETLGWAADAVVGEPYPDAFVGETEFETYLAALREGNVAEGVEASHRCADGSTLDVRVWTAPLFDDRGRFDGGVLALTDVTERNQRRERLSVLNRLLRHNVRNDLTVIHAHLDELSGDRRHVEAIERRLRNIQDLGETARRIERLTNSGADERTRVDLAAVVERRVARLRDAFPEAVVDLTCPATAPVVAHDLLPQALDNLLENAVEHNDAATPRVAVSVERATPTDGTVRVSVADNGPGLPPGERRVLERGTETQLRHSGGTGLWLANWIARASEGRLTVPDEPGVGEGGTVVRLVLPAA